MPYVLFCAWLFTLKIFCRFHIVSLFFFFKVYIYIYIFKSTLYPSWGSNLQPHDQESHALRTKSARHPSLFFIVEYYSIVGMCVYTCVYTHPHPHPYQFLKYFCLSLGFGPFAIFHYCEYRCQNIPIALHFCQSSVSSVVWIVAILVFVETEKKVIKETLLWDIS